MKQLIWPDNILNRTAKLIVMFLFTFIWLLDLIWYSLDLGYVVLKDFVPIYSLLIMYCFLFNRNLPIGGVTYDFEDGKSDVQCFRLLVFLGSLIIYVYGTFL
ncbi:hypothetical protein VIOR3934_02702 [Vibrio orientalis CIP 102891 = ATCC 33934]|uniref:Uncharacterized protein n=1 Tax=Vibrio orientalis CIP 102891 = ATCC 33934 TaxID=675816 RepID=F9SX19_VIBOR|nr:hypothetical protein VIOR3934_02702 [Vibrio orientalis CIP 102891 = ATCC 33934]KOO13324.1 hypothetical protein AKJ18_19125 [Vibrio xuii]